MKDLIKNIKPGIGLGKLNFGMIQSEVKYIIGLPNEIEVYQYLPETKERSENWYFKEYELSVSFSSEDDWKMVTISINSNFYSLWGVIKVGDTIEDIEKILIDKVIQYSFEDWSNVESPDHLLFELPKFNLNLWFDNKELSEIQWGPNFKDKHTINWPYNSNQTKIITDIGYKRYKTDYLFDKLNKHNDAWLNKIFDEKEKYADLLNDFPLLTQRENLSLENKSINYCLKMDERIAGSIIAKANLIHNELGNIGWMGIEWQNDLKILDDFLHVD